MSPDKPTPDDRPAPPNPGIVTPGTSSVPRGSEPVAAPLEGALTAEDIRDITAGGLTLGDAIRRIESPAE